MSKNQTTILKKIEVRSLIANDILENFDSRKLLVIAVSDEKNTYQGYRQLNDKIPENWQLYKIDGKLSVFPIVQGG